MTAWPPMSRAQRVTLAEIGRSGFPGYCELMLRVGLKSYTSVDWVLDALERRAFIERDDVWDYRITDAGRYALERVRP